MVTISFRDVHMRNSKFLKTHNYHRRLQTELFMPYLATSFIIFFDFVSNTFKTF